MLVWKCRNRSWIAGATLVASCFALDGKYSSAQQPGAMVPATMTFGPVPGFTTAAHPAPTPLVLPLGARVPFTLTNLRPHQTVRWDQAAGGGQGPSTLVACDALGRITVACTVLPEELRMECLAWVLPLTPATLEYEHTLKEDPREPLSEDMDNDTSVWIWKRESIGQVTRLAEPPAGALRPDGVGTADETYAAPAGLPLRLRARSAGLASSDPRLRMGLSALIEWRLAGRAIGTGRVSLQLPAGAHRLEVGPPAMARTLDLVSFAVTIHDDGNVWEDGSRIVLTATTEPPGLEEQVTWMAATKFGEVAARLGRGPLFSTSFASPWGPFPGGGLWQWIGVRAGNATLGFDSKVDFGLEVFSCAFADDDLQNDPAAAAVAYDGIPYSVAVTTQASDAVVNAMNLDLSVQTNLGGEILRPSLTFSGGLSQTINFPATSKGEAVHLFLEGMGESLPLYRFRTEAGAAVDATAFSVLDWREAVSGPFEPSGSVVVENDLGEGGSLDTCAITSTHAPDDPESGVVGTTDPYVAQLYDSLGRPAANQLVHLLAGNASVIRLRAPNAPSGSGTATLLTRTDSTGFVVVQVEYVGVGTSSLTFEQDWGGLPFPAPAIGSAAPVLFQAAAAPTPVVKKLEVTKLLQSGVVMNPCLRETSSILVFGEWYCFEATLSAALPAGQKVVWCRDGNPVENDQANRIEGTILYSKHNDPDPNSETNKSHFCLTAKVVVCGGNGSEPVAPAEGIDYDVKDKKTIPLCVHEYGPAGGQAAWAQEVAAINAIYNGTGVCFTLDPTDLVNHGGAEKKVSINSNWVSPKFQWTYAGTLADCVCNNASQQGSASKITIYRGATYANAFGIALGADEVLAADKICVTDAKWANTVGLQGSAFQNARLSLAHELGHILGLGHSDKNDHLMRCGKHRVVGSNKITPSQAATIYQNACDILQGN